MTKALYAAYGSTTFWCLRCATALSWLVATFARAPTNFLSTTVTEHPPISRRRETVVMNVTWAVLGTEYSDQVARVGDTVHFRFVGGHNVYVHPSGTCDRTDRIKVPVSKELGGARYTFTKDDLVSGEVTFACDFTFMCELFGMILSFDVVDESESHIPLTLAAQGNAAAFLGGVLQAIAWFVCDFVDTMVRFWGALTNWTFLWLFVCDFAEEVQGFWAAITNWIVDKQISGYLD